MKLLSYSGTNYSTLGKSCYLAEPQVTLFKALSHVILTQSTVSIMVINQVLTKC